MKTPSFCVLVLAAAFSSASAQHFVDYDNPLIPIGLRPGDSFHLVFVTSGTTNRNAGDGADTFPISHWNTFVNNQAAASTISAIQPTLTALTWNAVVSTTSVAARNNALVSAPVYRIDGQLVATGFDDLWDGSILAPIELTQNLTVAPAAQQNLVYTGSTSAGFPDSRYPLGNGTESAKTGRAAKVDAGWISGSDAERRNPTVSLRMYAMSELITIAIPPDADNDGLPDWYELAHTSPPSATALDPAVDYDQDGLTTLQEYLLDTRLSPINPDSDNDGLLDGENITVSNSDPRFTAWANAGIAYFGDSNQRTFRGEATMGTDPMNPDTDGDGLPDGVESNTGIWVSSSDTGTDPLNRDTDGDGLLDGVETNTGIFVSKSNTGTNPLLADTDGDGAGDWYEITASFTDPNSAADHPGIPYPLPAEDGTPAATDRPVKVFILSGQSNMSGIGYIEGPRPGSLDAITKQEGWFSHLLDENGEYASRSDVWFEGTVGISTRKWLAPGCGGGTNRIGPELGFGWVMGWYYDEPVLIIKASQGNSSLGYDMIPPGNAQYTVDGTTYAGYGDTPRTWPAGTTPAPGSDSGGLRYDRCFLDEADMHPLNLANGSGGKNATDVLDNFDTIFPDWAAQGFEIAGFLWWQGHKDGGEQSNQFGGVYANRYEDNLVSLIDSVRGYYGNRYPGKMSPEAPFVVATIGFKGGVWEPDSNSDVIHKAQLAISDPERHPRFAGNVASVDTVGYWRSVAESPGVEGYHYNNNAETYTLVGDALARAMISLQDNTSPPGPITFRIPPTPQNAGSIGMVATTANSPSGPVQYWFEIVDGANSGWTTSTSWEFTGLADGQSYDFRFKAKDALDNESDWSATASATASAAGDTTAPSPNPMTFAGPLTVLGENAISITATTASDINGVEYEFVCSAGGGPSSGWQPSAQFTATGLTPATSYTYIVRARDSVGNITADSTPESATTLAPDTTAPAPDPMAFASPPTALGIDTITMTATIASDPSGVEYFFEAVDGGTSSGWQNSPVHVDTGLSPGTGYGYRVRARDKSPAQNTTEWSAVFTATTEVPDETAPVISELSPLNGATDVKVTTNFTITFDEDITIGTGNITLKNLTDSTQVDIDVTDGSQVSTSGPFLIINPVANLSYAKVYAIQIDDTAITDLAGNPFAGISNDTTWSFATLLAPLVVDGNWNVDASGNWSVPGNWLTNPENEIPGAEGSTVGLNNNISAARTVTINTESRTVGTLHIGDSDNTHGFTLVASGGAGLVLDNNGTGAAIVETGSVADTLSAPVTLADNLGVSVAGTLTMSGIISETAGAQSITKSGAGTLILTGDNTYSGGFTLNAGTVQVATANNQVVDPYNGFGTGILTLNGGTIRTQSAGSFTTANNSIWNANFSLFRGTTGTATWNHQGNVTLNANIAPTAPNNGFALNINGNIGETGGARSLTFSAGNLITTLSGNNTYSGGTTLTSGRLNLGSATALGDGPLAINGGTIDNTSGSPLTVTNAYTIGGNFTFGSTNNLILTGDWSNPTNNRTVTLQGTNSTLTIHGTYTNSQNNNQNFVVTGPGNTLVFGGLALSHNASSRTVTIQGTGNLTVTGAVTNGGTAPSGNLVKGSATTHTGTLTLAGSNTYTGTTTINAGTLVLTGATQATSAITFTGGTLGLDTGSPVTAASAAVDLTNGTLNVTGATDAPSYTLLTAASITGTPVLAEAVPGYELQIVGNQLRLVQTGGASPYDTWSAQIADPNLRGRNDDADGDGFTNAQEFLFGTSPIEPNGSLTTTETSGPNLIIRWKQLTSGAVYTLLQSSTLENDWIPSSVLPVNDGSTVGDYQPRMATVPIGSGKLFLRVEAVEN